MTAWFCVENVCQSLMSSEKFNYRVPILNIWHSNLDVMYVGQLTVCLVFKSRKCSTYLHCIDYFTYFYYITMQHYVTYAS